MSLRRLFSSPVLHRHCRHVLQQFYCSSSQVPQTDGEKKIAQTLKAKFPGATEIQVADISGGCGSMFEIMIEAEEFKGLRTVKQHMLVNQALKEEIKEMHGLRINTKAPG